MQETQQGTRKESMPNIIKNLGEGVGIKELGKKVRKIVSKKVARN